MIISRIIWKSEKPEVLSKLGGRRDTAIIALPSKPR
jgi:hypothetical protein